MVESTGMRRGIEWMLDARSIPIRLLVLTALAAGCLLLLTRTTDPLDWAIALASVLLTAGGVRWPLATALTTTAVLMVGFEFGHTGPVVAKVAAAIALTELAARHRGWRPLLGAAVLAGAYLLHPGESAAATAYRAAVMAGLPLLIGSLLRTARDSAARARHQAHELAQRRESEVAAARALERTAIARELHDLIAHHVSSTVLRVGIARHALPDAPPAVLEVLDDIHASGRETLADLRKLVTVLRDPNGDDESFLAPADLPDALAAAVERARRLGIRTHAEVDAAITDVDALTGLTLLRLTQEGLANTVRHAGPGARAALTIVRHDEKVDFTLRDQGSAARTGDGPPGVGLIGLRERVELLGGAFTAAAVTGGWRVTAQLPTRSRVAP
ncbi:MULTISPECIES: histidine kinase [unclassified Nocardia]|uniref:sensor histidine kinase n=1 Tax=unclassified Nocardia TaxID=2637762 RepID=UPI0024A93D62|nr:MULTISPECIES: histidine kinase [unclassified Nocardia]